MKLKIKHIFAVLLFLCFGPIHAQDLSEDLKSWTNVGLSYKINQDFRLKANHTLALNLTTPVFSFSQTSLALSYRIKSGVYVEGGYLKGLFNHSRSLERQGAYSSWFNTLSVDRVYGRFSYKQKLVKRLSLYHRLEYQYFLPDLNKYKTRSLYTAKLSYNVRRSSVSPYLEGRVYYYHGGQKVSNGIKRYRLKTGASFKPVKDSSMRLSIYYLFQNEFKTKPLSDNDYMVLGTSISFRIK
ncbi:DUF2490 domain-containing protein [Sunxiuqinia elliptica]|uniref:Uncharacterized protein DUF2490 n=1 Tax=Sunxiuqinia elliptica TaxID=655355 RepID=A0A4R6H5N0_9BACT|nr:DUF2490 domain-containing protein [Sunxiuqinia elliptica]TDO03197.1 uncharacterized protein DUF2490 [Sunxiuqinia elliptica]TDO59394.1 uncharacterized protein DUF2490 [Sunxiuqinia elliptica]